MKRVSPLITKANQNILLRGELQPEYREGEGVGQRVTAKILFVSYNLQFCEL